MKNAKITTTTIGLDNGTFTACIYLNGQGFGGTFYVVGGLTESFAMGVLTCAGVETWEDLPGKMIRVADSVCGTTTIERITHITDDEIYFDVNDTRSHDDWIARGPTEEALSHDDHARGLRRTQFEAPTKIEAVKAVKDSAEASGLFDPETPASEVQPKLADLTLGVAKTRRQNLWAGDLRDTDSFTDGFLGGRLWALARLASILSASQRTQAKELLGITESEWSEIPEPGFKPLSRDDLVDTCWTIAVDGSESSTMRAKAIDTLVELVAR